MTSNLRYVDTLPVTGKRVLLRVDFNVPYGPDGKILDDTRIREALPTIRHLIAQRARVVIASHLGRPQGRNPEASLLAVGEQLALFLNQEVIFPEDCIGDAAKKLVHDLKEGGVMLLENLRFHPEEEQNDPVFASRLASLADVYINDAFGALHRAHASTAGIVAHFKEKGAGFLIKKELEMLETLLTRPERPFYAVLGGAKVADKIGVIENLLGKVDGLLIGGALAYTFLKARGIAVGKSRVEEEKVYLAQKILKLAQEKQVEVFLPVDHKVVDRVDPGASVKVVTSIPEGAIGVDIGPETVNRFREKLSRSKTVFWNGPMGIFEIAPFAEGTFEMAKAIARPGVTSVVGGGESVTACRQAGVAEKISHLSTGGGATLEYLEGKALPGLKALEG